MTRAEIDFACNPGIRQALRAGDMDLAQTLVSHKVGRRICAGDLVVKLKPVRL